MPSADIIGPGGTMVSSGMVRLRVRDQHRQELGDGAPEVVRSPSAVRRSRPRPATSGRARPRARRRSRGRSRCRACRPPPCTRTACRDAPCATRARCGRARPCSRRTTRSPWCPPPTVIDDRKMITPLSGMWSSAACATSAGAMALVVMTSCQVSALTSSSGASGETAVENTSASRPPIASTASATMPEQRSGSRTSAAMPVPFPAVVTTSFSLSSLRPTTVMSAPARRRRARCCARCPTTRRRRAGADQRGRCRPTSIRGPRRSSAEPMPPPAHIDSRPRVFPRRRSSWTIVTTMRAPVAAIG